MLVLHCGRTVHHPFTMEVTPLHCESTMYYPFTACGSHSPVLSPSPSRSPSPSLLPLSSLLPPFLPFPKHNVLPFTVAPSLLPSHSQSPSPSLLPLPPSPPPFLPSPKHNVLLFIGVLLHVSLMKLESGCGQLWMWVKGVLWKVHTYMYVSHEGLL